MRKSRIPIDLTVGLIASSLLLLMAFLVFWLYSVYEDQEELLSRQANSLFVESVRSLQDSLVMKLVEQSGTDTMVTSREVKLEGLTAEGNAQGLGHKMERSFFITDDSMETPSDTADGKVRVVVSSTTARAEGKDAAGLLSSIILKFHSKGDTVNPLLSLGKDSLKIKEIEQAFRYRLMEADIPLSFFVWRQNPGEEAPPDQGLSTEPIRGDFPLRHWYLALFPAWKAYLLQQMVPQIGFSLLLFFFTALAFGMLYRNMQQQKLLSELKNDFISNVTHELKTPITTVGVAIEALNNFNALKDPTKTQEYLDISRNELNRLSMLVDRVLKMSIFEQKEPELQTERIDLKELTGTILNAMKLQFEQAGAKISFISEGKDFQLKGDRIHLTSVIYNLLDNALKYSEGEPDIEVALKNSGTEIMLSISDKGIGIAPGFQSRIFEKFFRVPNGDRHNTKGHGLGLSYVASVIEKHHGRISVESRENEGTRFMIVLPG